MYQQADCEISSYEITRVDVTTRDANTQDKVSQINHTVLGIWLHMNIPWHINERLGMIMVYSSALGVQNKSWK